MNEKPLKLDFYLKNFSPQPLIQIELLQDRKPGQQKLLIEINITLYGKSDRVIKYNDSLKQKQKQKKF